MFALRIFWLIVRKYHKTVIDVATTTALLGFEGSECAQSFSDIARIGIKPFAGRMGHLGSSTFIHWNMDGCRNLCPFAVFDLALNIISL
mgnify:CR=1 FL=1